MLESVPAFVALNLEVAACRRVAALQRDLRAAPSVPPSLAWTSPTNLRVVLRYLGPVDPALAPAVLDPLRDWIAGLPPLRLVLGGVEAFPAADRARLILLPVADAGATLVQLADQVQSVLQELGLPEQKHPFHAHLTLARLPEPADVQSWLASIPAFSCEARVTELAAYVHVQRRAGAEHVALDRLAFAPPPRTSQRPSKAPRQPSQRPSKRPKADPSAAKLDKIPSPPRVPNISGPSPQAQPPGAPSQQPAPVAPAPAAPSQQQPAPIAPPPAAPAAAPAATSSSPPRSSILPPALEAALPPEDDWGA